MNLNESYFEEAALEWFLLRHILRQGYGGQVGELGYAIGHGPQMAPSKVAAQRDTFGDVVLGVRLREAIRRLIFSNLII